MLQDLLQFANLGQYQQVDLRKNRKKVKLNGLKYRCADNHNP